METSRATRVRELFYAALALGGNERAELLETACADDPEIRAEVERLLARDPGTDELPIPPPLRVDDPLQSEPSPPQIPGHRVLHPIGAGGMGVVWAAEQYSPARRVAVKVLRPTPSENEIHARLFEREIEALARLEHPGITRIYESGRAKDGRLYFTMELVKGEPLDRFLTRAFEKGPPTRARLDANLRLFGRICDAVHHAHQRGIIHRDLKPSNILVLGASSERAADESAPGIKILDFGLARAMALDADPLLSRSGTVRGTLTYMSPEQARGDTAVDVRSDVYSLGVMLFQLLTGSVPHDLHGMSLTDAIGTICDREAAPVLFVEATEGQAEAELGVALDPFVEGGLVVSGPSRSNGPRWSAAEDVDLAGPGGEAEAIERRLRGVERRDEKPLATREALDLTYDKIVDANVSAEANWVRQLSDSRLHMFVMGGDSPDQVLALFQGDISSLEDYIVNGDDVETGVPLSYALRNLSDNSPIGVKVATEYDVLDCEIVTVGDRYSSFDGGTRDGWFTYGGGANLACSNDPDGGHGYYLQAEDGVGGDYWYFSAPTKFTGDWSELFGGTLTYYTWISRSSDLLTGRPDIVIEGTQGRRIRFRYADQGLPYPDASGFKRYDIMLDPRFAWVYEQPGTSPRPATDQDILDVFSDVDAFRIRGEYTSGNDWARVDEIQLVRPE